VYGVFPYPKLLYAVNHNTAQTFTFPGYCVILTETKKLACSRSVGRDAGNKNPVIQCTTYDQLLIVV